MMNDLMRAGQKWKRRGGINLARLMPLITIQCVLVAIIAASCGRSSEPESVVLRVRDQAQMGMNGSYCWERTCADASGVPIPARAIVISAREAIALDFGEIGIPNSVSFKVYEYDDVTQREGKFNLMIGSRSESGPVFRGELQPQPVVHLSLDVPPGHYAMWLSIIHPKGNIDQGFNLVVR